MYEWCDYSIKPLNLLKQIMNASDGSDDIYIVTGSFGDVYVQLSLLSEIMTASRSPVVIVDGNYQLLATNVLPNQAKLITANTAAIRQMLNRLGVLGNNKNFPIPLLPTLYPMIPECIHEGILKYCDFIRLLIKSTSSGKLLDIENYEAQNVLATAHLIKAGGKPGSSVIICPENNTNTEFEPSLWNNICEWMSEFGLTPMINASQKSTGANSSDAISTQWPRLTVPPHMAVTLTSVAGGYVSGTNGYATIQALFNKHSFGLHLINANTLHDDKIINKFGIAAPKDIFFHENFWSDQFLNIQKEKVINRNMSLEDLRNTVEKLFNTKNQRLVS